MGYFPRRQVLCVKFPTAWGLTGGYFPHTSVAMSNLISEIETFCAKHSMSEWQFGEAVLNDRHFLRQLRTGRDLRMSTLERVQTFMREYSPQQSAA